MAYNIYYYQLEKEKKRFIVALKMYVRQYCVTKLYAYLEKLFFFAL
jgi:hypothetical protein